MASLKPLAADINLMLVAAKCLRAWLLKGTGVPPESVVSTVPDRILPLGLSSGMEDILHLVAAMFYLFFYILFLRLFSFFTSRSC